MKWTHVQANWPAFYEAILEKWEDADESTLDEIDGDQRAFVRYIAEITEQEPEEARDEIKQWLIGEIPSDIVMDPPRANRYRPSARARPWRCPREPRPAGSQLRAPLA